MIRERLIISGNISEGGIRYFVQMKSSTLSLSGYVKRGLEGDIIVEAQGEKENIDKLKEKLKIGNGFFKVSEIKAEKIDIVSGEKFFAIK
ncbi:acylphosphatase [Clostridium uliginosum]|uniref:Acylphosphatase n=1 Tax=Clostridium uliginosum TaxID=119641 RepID=A0A1I1N0J1_9CLOT|nr:acylphosphatase [Clostridium uliginosum]SFC90672.1 acylphosphatase [Clostridium uliginosum]